MFVKKEFLIISILLLGLFAISYFETTPVKQLMDWKASRSALTTNEVSLTDYQVYDHTDGTTPDLTIDFLKGKHFWNPQVAIWLEDSTGKFIETLLVTTSTARGLFYSGRSASNFRDSDEIKEEKKAPTRRVNALPYWSHKRGHQYADGFYTPPPGQPLPDAITAPTPKENFYFKSASRSFQNNSSLRVIVEVNVAFDENEYYSEYDFTDDSLYHGGTGLLGQPSLIYGATIKRSDDSRFYLLSLLGHGHHSGSTGELIPETETVTTAKYIVERIVVGVNEAWYEE